MPLYWLVYRHNNSISVVIEQGLMLLLLLATPTIAEPIDPSDIRVIDGDTIRVYHQQPNVRLVGFNAPETRRAPAHAAQRSGEHPGADSFESCAVRLIDEVE